MVLLQRQAQGGNTWRLKNANGESIGRIWNEQHVLRMLRDSDLAEQIADIMALSGAARRQAARTAIQAWNAAGGRGESLGTLTASPLNDGGIEDGNTHLYLDGTEIGYFHGDLPARVARMLRFIALAEDVADAEALPTNAERNVALDAAVNRFRDNGAISGG